ncbi:MAG: hypothetical protein WC758_07555 [Candidatus Woesearchaeota archaeon]|jgi:hypothetical protein
MDNLKLEKILIEESKGLSLKEKRKLYKEVADYLLNVCPKNYKLRCDECMECK